MSNVTLVLPRVVFLDLDGVIADTFWIHERGWHSILALYGKLKTKDCWDMYRGVPTRQAIIQLLEEHSIEYDEKDLDFFVPFKIAIRDYLLEKINRTSVLPFSESVLRCADHWSIEVVCLATTTAAERILTMLGLDKYFKAIICGSGLIPPKKDGADAIVNYIMNRSILINNVLFIDDDWRAIAWARAEGIPSMHINEAHECIQDIAHELFIEIEMLYAEAIKINNRIIQTK